MTGETPDAVLADCPTCGGEGVIDVRAYTATVEADHACDHAALRAAEALLREWLAQWRDHDDMPSKMADALHVRTALYLEGPEAAALADRPAGGAS